MAKAETPDMVAAKARAKEQAKAAEEPGLHREPGLPVDTYRDAAIHLRRPFTAEAVRWKVQTLLGQEKKNGKADPTTAKGGLIVGYIDARLVIERLNLVCPHLWREEEPQAIGQNLMLCRLTVDGLTRGDVGEGTGKGLWSDAFKRAAVKFGVGVSLYAMSAVTFWRAKGEDDTDGGRLRPNYRKHLELDDANRAWLREKYQGWLDGRGGEMFGPPLDHGDVLDAVGDPEDPDAQAATGDAENAGDEPEAAPQLDDERAKVLRAKAAELNGELGKEKRMLPAEFKQRLKDAGTSHDDLQAFITELQARAEQ